MHDYLSTSTIGYYLLAVQPNLFGTWSLIREWGRIGHPSQMKIDLCDSREEASAVFDEKLRRLLYTGGELPERPVSWSAQLERPVRAPWPS
jgi:hypothetical protein